MARRQAAAKSNSKKEPAPDAPFAAKEWPANRPVMTPLSKIIPYPNNPRTHPPAQIALLAELMKKRGVDQPIVVDDDGVILKGHGRLLAATLAGFEEFPIVVHRGLSEVEKRAMRIEDNQVSLLSGWDSALIQGEIFSLKTSGYDIQLLGFAESQLRGWNISLGVNNESDPEVLPDRPTKLVVRRRDVWILGDHRIICGDSTNPDDVSLIIAGDHPNLCVTDPPYGVEYNPKWRSDVGVNKNKKKMGIVQNDDRADWTDAYNLFPGNILYAWSAAMRSKDAIESIEKIGFQIVAQIIWAKDRFALARGDYHFQHEPCWYAVRKGKNHNWNGGRSQTTLWNIPAREDAGHGHSTQKPIECMKRPIENNSKKGDSIYEPFSGSGTTIIACEMTGRRCVAVEIDPIYVQLAIDRWQEFTGRKALLDGFTLDQVSKSRKAGKPRGLKEKGAADTAAP